MRRAFTLVEIMIVVLIIGVLLTIALPNFMKARDSSRANSCIENLRQIAGAKEEAAMDLKLADWATPRRRQLTPNYIKTWPTCPSGGRYRINDMSTNPTCNITTPIPHALPN